MKFSIHPLFLAAGLLTVIFGGFPVFVIYALTALLHECGHIFCASKLGYDCSRVSLMPYGAAAVCDIEEISPGDEIKLALAGPAVNALICVICAGLWWFFPLSYPYTESIFSASAVMLVINVFPAYPLDGGRVLKCVLSRFVKVKTALICCRALSGALAAALAAAFAFVRNPSFIVFAAFLACSAFTRGNVAPRIKFAAPVNRRGKEIKYVMLTPQSTFRDAFRHLDGKKYVIFQFFSDGVLDEVDEKELFEKLSDKSVYDRII